MAREKEQRNVVRQKILYVSMLLIMFFVVLSNSNSFAQTQRNPVLEYCTGTWCVFCPQGHAIIANTILPNIPNAIILGYHGPANGTDPFSYFPGNGIISSFGFNSYPTGIVDRVSGIQSRGSWFGLMSNRNSVPATVAIDVTRSFNPDNRKFSANLSFTALSDLDGEYNYSVILVESGMVWAQTGGSSNYVHHHVVRAMMNGALGEQVVNGNWNTNDVINKSMEYTIPVPGGPGPDIIFDSCRVAVVVYKVGSPLSANAEIQQAVEMELFNPDYMAQMTADEKYYLGASSETATYTTYIKNIGLMPDTYNVELGFNGPAGWTQTFTTINGTFNLGETDTVSVNPGDSTMIEVTVNANSESGYGRTTVNSVSDNGAGGSVELRFTTFGLDVLVVDDDSGENHEDYITQELETLSYEYGVITSNFIPANISELNSYNKIIWDCANSEPTINPEEMNAIKTFLDGGGNLYLNGVDIAYELADPTSPYYSTETEAFFTNYLHSTYILKEHGSQVAQSIDGDPITDGMSLMGLTGGTGAGTIDHANGDYANQIEAGDQFSANILSFFLKPNEHPAIRSLHEGTIATGRVVFTTFGFETIAVAEIRAEFAERVLNWLNLPTGINNEDIDVIPNEYMLSQNYPNPFNPSTIITYQIPETEIVSLKIYDIMGQVVTELVNEKQSAGRYSVEFDASSFSSGLYIYSLTAGKFISTKKMVLMK